MGTKGYDVFISYSRMDAKHATDIHQLLEGKGLRTFFDRSNLPLGLPWLQALEKAIDDSKAVLILVGPSGFGNTQQYERQYAIFCQTREHALPVIPVILPGAGNIPVGFLHLLTWIDFSRCARVIDAPGELERLLLALRGDETRSAGPREAICPYRGLDAFREEDASFFFGRGNAEDATTPIGALVQKVREHSFVMVVGRSGTGKSSLVFAGLMPALRRNRDKFWTVVSIRPGSDALRALAEAFNPRDPDQGAAEYATKITREVEALQSGDRDQLAQMVADYLATVEGKPDRLLLYVDQWEELYSQAPDTVDPARAGPYRKKVERFIELLLTASRIAPVTVVATVRADFYDPLIRHQELQTILPAQQVILTGMSRTDLEQTITEPAKILGLTFDPPKLVQNILDDVGNDDGMLPLLQFALKETWARRDDGKMTLAAYEAAGGVKEAIKTTAERTFENLSPGEQQAARQLFLRLVTPGEGKEDTRARAVMPEAEIQRKIVQQFASAKARLLVTGSDRASRPIVEVAHEALIRTWPRLREWIDTNREKLRWRAAIVEAKKEWELQDKREDMLLPAGFQLERARTLLNDPGDITIDDISEFVSLSVARAEKDRIKKEEELKQRQEAQRRKARAQLITTCTLSGAALIVAFFLGLLLWETRQTQRRETFVMTGIADRAMSEARYERAMRAALEDLPTGFRMPWHLGWSAPEIEVLEAKLAGAAQASRSQLRLDVHGGEVRSATFSPDGARLLTASEDGVARIWDPGNGALIAELKGHEKGIISAQFNLRGTKIVTASIDHTARIWDTATGAQLVRISGHGGIVFSAAFSPDEKIVATASADGTARLWDAATGRQLLSLEPHAGTVTGVAFNPNGDRVVTALQDRTARVWDTATGAQTLELQGHGNAVRGVAFSPDGTRIVTASWDHTARVWDARTGAELLRLDGHSDAVRSAVFSPDGTRIATASNDGTARVWDARTGATTLQFNGHRAAVVNVAFDKLGERIATASEDGTARVWDCRDPRSLLRLDPGTGFIIGGAFSRDGTRIATASSGRIATIWNASNGNRLVDLVGHEGVVRSVSFNRDGSRIVTASSDKTARVWDTATGHELLRIEGQAPFRSAAFSPDGQRIVTASEDRTATVWSAADASLLLSLKGHQDALWSATFSPLGDRIVTASEDATARVWDAQTGTALAVLRGHDGQAVVSAAFSPDGTRIVTASWDHTALVWDANTGRILPAPIGNGPMKLAHKGFLVFSAAFSPAGDRIVTASGDRNVHVWDATTGVEILSLKGHSANVRAAVFSPDSARLLTTSEDGTALVWDARWLATLHGDQLAYAVCHEKLVGDVQEFNYEDRAADSALSDFVGENACHQYGRPRDGKIK